MMLPQRFDFALTFHLCLYLMDLSETLGNPTALVTLDLSGFKNLEESPKTLYDFISLNI